MSVDEASIVNLSIGPPPGMTPQAFQTLHLSLSGGVGVVALVLARRYLKLSQVPLSFLWILYFVVGMVFHLCAWLAGDAQSYGALGLTLVHTYIEGLLCIKVLEGQASVVNAWATWHSVYFCAIAFLGLILWQPLNLFVVGSLLALPTSILVWPAGMAMAKRTRYHTVFRLGYVWALKCPMVCALYALLVWGAKSDNNFAGIATLSLQGQYIALGLCWIQAYGKLDKTRVGVLSSEEEDCEGLGILPVTRPESLSSEQRPLVGSNRSSDSSSSSRESSGMRQALLITVVVMLLVFVVAVAIPLLLNRIELSMILTNACQTYRPGNVQMLSNVGPHFVVPNGCS